ncbi:hypothetical protein BCR35DRAFT_302478 [Leucosporidium creatinivorum]|uniref:Mannose-P-dolichol utilization defect 1 protein homolog n=1 Tax=Leucosporidium creatinivorum TaxID=106004 RepID=A0A1Y2FRV8_9BASI|nr:hypothetical protein BCR35DRAFT_302478 [Leucosporidium creatinivorum]
MAALQVITHRLPWIVKEPAVALIGQECYDSLIYNTNFSDSACIQYSISKALGFGIVLGGSIVKVPQIIKIVRSHSARGLSLSSYLLDTAATGITVAYNVRNEFPWSTYGESVFLLVQNVVIITLIVLYSPRSSPATLALILGALGTSTYLLSSPLTPLSTLKLLLSASIPLSLSSKLPQIISNFKLGSTGQLSAFLVFNSLAGCLARVYTTSTETGDIVLWWGFALGALLNGVIGAQMLASWNQEGSVAAEKVKEKVEDELEKVEVHPEAETPVKKVQQGASPKVSRTSSPASAKRYVRKLE